MSKKKELNPKEAASLHLEKLRKSAGKRCKYDSRTVKQGTGKIVSVYDGGRGAWVKVSIHKDEGGGDVIVRPSQVTLY